ncbi:MAG: UDP-N-acetyl glucosamine 2-epimerase [Candidatus Thermoplasmatota archaeon]|nr:UDP-N-acetyl glucosamine 2-epimerase [Candidatus Thermoplasmatota archaeon]
MGVKPKVIHIVGARPQFIKYAAICRIIVREHLTESFDNILLHTGQHYDYSMSQVFFDELGIEEPNYHLGVGSGSQGEQTAKIMIGVENILMSEKPDLIIVYGDTNSTVGGALSASKLHIPVAHVEAGLRSYNKKMPEEINRVLTDHISTLLLCPTKVATQNLIREGFTNLIYNGDLIDINLIDSLKFDHSKPVVINVGDVMYDLFVRTNSKIQNNSKILKELNLEGKNYWLITLHRAENTEEEKIPRICEDINNIVGDDIAIFPMHPRTKKVYQKLNIKFNKNVKIIEPLSYHDLLALLVNSHAIVTDSGGVQKESYWARVPCITLRDETEWVETIESGWNVLYKDYNNNKYLYDINRDHPSFYGDGNASERIVKLIIKFINNKGF